MPTAESRFESSAGRTFDIDNCLKLFVVGGSTVIGFVGSLHAASQLLRTLFKQVPNHRNDPVSLYQWLPRLFRYEYAKVKPPNLPVSFLIGSTILGHGNIIERQAVVDLANYMFFSPERKVKTNWCDAKLVRLLSAPPEAPLIGIDAPFNLLYRLDSPEVGVSLTRVGPISSMRRWWKSIRVV